MIHLEPTELPDELELQIGLTQAIHKYDVDEATYARKTGDALRSGARASPRRWPFVGGVAAVVVAIAVTIWWVVGRELEPAARFPATTIAVMPSEDFSPSADQQWLANGMTEALA